MDPVTWRFPLFNFDNSDIDTNIKFFQLLRFSKKKNVFTKKINWKIFFLQVRFLLFEELFLFSRFLFQPRWRRKKSCQKLNSPLDKTMFFLKKESTQKLPTSGYELQTLLHTLGRVLISRYVQFLRNTLDHMKCYRNSDLYFKKIFDKKKVCEKIYNTGTDWRSAPNNATK